MTALRPDLGERFATALLDVFDARSRALGDLDRQAGDGDFGTNISAAMENTRREIASASPTTFSAWATAVSRGFLGTGGTSGPLFGMFYRDLAQCVNDDAAGDGPTVSDLAAGLSRGVATVQRYGKAAVGDKTMVDAFAPAAETLTARSDEGVTALAAAADAAREGARSTSDLVARRGRASYVGEVARGVLDPGAAAAALMVEALAAAGSEADAAVVDASWIDGS